jgi:hypothetical protein
MHSESDVEYQAPAQGVGVGEVAVVGDRDAANVAVADRHVGEEGLYVAVQRAARRRVAVVANRAVALEAVERAA